MVNRQPLFNITPTPRQDYVNRYSVALFFLKQVVFLLDSNLERFSRFLLLHV